jgi:uncharacterized protein YjbI with pentapeptide repeats
MTKPPRLAKADLTDTDLTEANLGDASLRDATATDVTLKGADLREGDRVTAELASSVLVWEDDGGPCEPSDD